MKLVTIPRYKNIDLNQQSYLTLYQQSIQTPEKFWGDQALKCIEWFAPWTKVCNGDFNQLDINWFVDGKLNACYNCIDRHLAKRAQAPAIIWQGDDPAENLQLTYAELHELICKFANVLQKNGVKKGDRVCIYLPMIPEIIIAMLAIVRIGAVHSVVFSAFSADSLKKRILDADCQMIVTADESIRGGKSTSLKKNVDQALADCPRVKKVIVVARTGNKIAWNAARDSWYHEEMQNVSAINEATALDSADPLFILYTSGSTGNPKGILHTTGGYLVYVALTFKTIFNYQPGDIYWCTADLGWITGHSYLLYGPLLNGATTLLFEGTPYYPNFSRFWNIIDQYQVNIFYTAPTAIRALRKEGDIWVSKTKRSSLKLLGTVGEPINPDVWQWYFDVVGNKRCPIVDTWWQTETGGILISAIPGLLPLKPGSAVQAFFGIAPEIVDEQGQALPPGKAGKLVIKQPWPGMMKTIYGNHERFVETYFKKIPGKYLSGDSAYCDADGYYWIIGREDDVIKVSGHRIGTGELESALLTHTALSEAAVVAIPHDIKGSSIYAFVTLKSGITPSDDLAKELKAKVREIIGPIAVPEWIQWTKNLPKTRSGKIMRRILRKIANDEFEDFGDTSTLADPSILEELIATKKVNSSD